MSKTRTTKEDFRVFKDAVYEFQKKLGLNEWHIYVFHDRLDSFASTQCSQAGACASVTLSTIWDNRDIDKTELRECALHEVLHILTAPLLLEATARYASEFAIDTEEHTIVTRLTNLLKEIL